MSISMQGSWTVRVKSKSAGFAQRFQIIGSDNGVDANYAGVTTTPAVFVTGPQWAINIQNQPPSQPWQDSKQRVTFPTTSGGLVKFDINSDDAGGDLDYNDLVLTCSMPVSSSEFIVYGNVRTYAGSCFFNPCYPWYYVIDRPSVLAEALKRPDLRKVIEKLYPERVREFRRPGPIPDPPPDFRPIVIPTGSSASASGIEFRATRLALSSAADRAGLPEAAGSAGKAARERASAKTTEPGKVDADKLEADAVARLKGTAHLVQVNSAPVASGLSLLHREDLLAIAKVFDRNKLLFFCDVENAPGLLLRFQEYDRTAAEKLGGPYTGEGSRENLGLAVTDELGNYIFHFSRTLDDLAAEASDIGAGESFSTQIRPDVIVQVLGSGLLVDYESAPYYNILNLMRIDLCLPYDRVHPNRACAGDRVVQRIGDIILLHSALSGHPNRLDTDGRITCRNANAPSVNCAAWRGGLRLYCCFGKPEVSSYSIQFKRPTETDWHFVSEEHRLNFIPAFSPTYTGTPVGSTLRNVHVFGGGVQNVPTYDNHEDDLNYIENDLKIILSSGLYRPVAEPGPVQFHIEAYDGAGNLVAATSDDWTLYIDNKPTTGDITSISMNGQPQSDCGLFEMSDHKAPLEVRYRVQDPEGFVQSWGLSVTRGNNNPVTVSATAGVPLSNSYPAAAPDPCTDFVGTEDSSLLDVNGVAVVADSQGYVTTTLVPAASADWLPAGVNFCAFAFTLTANDRTTDGRNAYPQAVFWQDLVGISYP